MAKKRNMKNRKKSNGNWTKDDRAERVVGFSKKNDKLFLYYKRQGLVPEDEWDSFVETLQKDLPVAFRIQGCHKDREALRVELETKYIEPIAHSSADEAIFEPKRLPWYDGAYQTPMSRTEVRSHPKLARLHNFLVTEAELGNISRQEAVSMIPPLLLAPLPHHNVLDVCAAPGSKTMQLIEMMHEGDKPPTGMIVANDVDKKRSYLLCHQVLKRMKSTNAVVTCEDGSLLPNFLNKDGSVLKFDRVLCDVICSGDGTVRKNPDIWEKWTPQEGIGLHKLQLSIARRAVHQLKEGGLLVYSTCSMNPLEDEAVVSALLRESRGGLRLVDAHSLLPQLKAKRGVSTWKVIDRDMDEYARIEDVTAERLKKALVSSMWPPTHEEADSFNLHHTMRILPHQQNTGGFFVALIEKVVEKKEGGEPEGTVVRAPPHKKNKMFKDDPFTFLQKDDPRWFDLQKFYGLSDDFPYENLFNRMQADANSRQLFIVNSAVKEFIMANMKFVSIQNAGTKIFGRNENKVESVRFRLSQEGVQYAMPFMSKQKVKVDKEDMLTILKTVKEGKGGDEKAMVSMELLKAKDALRAQQAGTVVVYVDEEHPVCAWVGQHTAAPYVGKEERIHLLRILGEDTHNIEELMKTKRKEKAARDRQAAIEERDEGGDGRDTVDNGKDGGQGDCAPASDEIETKRIKLDEEQVAS